MAYGYCDSCQRNIESQNGEYVCALTGCTTGINDKCKKYLPDMTNFEHIKNMGVEEMAHFFVETPPFCEHFMGGECIYGWHDCPENKCVLHANFPKKSVRKGYVVEFDAFDEGKRCLRAVNIKLVSYGIHHPFCNPILNICRFIEENTSDSVEKGYKLRELQMLYNYFVDIEDTDVHDLRRKYKPETYTLDTNIKNKEG